MVVEHDEETILESDYVIDIGVGAGINGGSVVATGKPNEIKKSKKSITGQYLSKSLNIEIEKQHSRNSNNYIQLEGARGNNLKDLNIKFL